MKLNCAVLDDYQQVALSMADWSKVAEKTEIRVYTEHMDSEDEVAAAVQDCEIVVIMRERTPFRSSLFERLPRLKLLVTTGMRNASVDLAAARRHGVTVCGTGGGGEGTTELTWALILGLARQLVPEFEAFRSNGPWQHTIGADLYGKQLGLLGLGRIGSQVARIAQAFGMRVVAWSQNLTRDKAEAAGARLASSLDEVMATGDFVSIHLVLSERTRGLIGAEALGKMKPSAFLINTSRGPIVDQEALIEVLKNRRIAGAGMDVYDTEPLPAGHIYRSLPNVLATPHIGYVTETSYRTFFQGVVEAIEAFLLGAPIRVMEQR